MGVTRRQVLVLVAVVAVVVAAVAVTVRWDPLALEALLRGWLAVGRPADGSGATLVDAVARRQARVQRLRTTLDRDPTLSVASIAVGLGTGILGGALGTFLYQRRRIRRGEWSE